MSNHDYTPQEALDTLLSIVRQRDSELMHKIQIAIDAGTEDQEEERSGGKKKTVRKYKVNRPYSPAEALDVAIGVLQAYFVETPLFINSALTAFEQAAIGASVKSFAGNVERDVSREDEGKSKEVQIELKTETQISQSDQEVFPLEARPPEEIEKQKENIAQLKKLVTFS